MLVTFPQQISHIGTSETQETFFMKRYVCRHEFTRSHGLASSRRVAMKPRVAVKPQGGNEAAGWQ